MPPCSVTMAALKLIGIFCLVSVLKGTECNACDLSSAGKCFGAAGELVPRIYWNPVDIELLYDITQNYCDNKLDACADTLKGNCSLNSVAPYLTVSNTIRFLCDKDLSEYSSCVGNADLQEAMAFCFQTFKEEYDVSMRDPTLSNEELKKSLCNSYKRVGSCAADMAVIMCDTRSRLFIRQLLLTATHANLQVLDCN